MLISKAFPVTSVQGEFFMVPTLVKLNEDTLESYAFLAQFVDHFTGYSGHILQHQH